MGYWGALGTLGSLWDFGVNGVSVARGDSGAYGDMGTAVVAVWGSVGLAATLNGVCGVMVTLNGVCGAGSDPKWGLWGDNGVTMTLIGI